MGKQLDPRFHSLLNDLMALASTMEQPGVIIWVADVASSPTDFQSRTYLGGVRAGHILAALDSIATQGREVEGAGADPVFAKAIDEIRATLRALTTSEVAGIGPIPPANIQ